MSLATIVDLAETLGTFVFLLLLGALLAGGIWLAVRVSEADRRFDRDHGDRQRLGRERIR